MNRIQPAVSPRARIEQGVPSPEPLMGRFLSSTAARAFSLFSPLHYEPNYGYPLLVWLHGPRDDERQLTRIMPLVSLRNYVAVAPRAPGIDARASKPENAPDKADSEPSRTRVAPLDAHARVQRVEGNGWEDCVWGVGAAAQDMVEQRILEAIAAATENYHVRPDRVFLAGFDRGGTTALRIGLANPESFAGVISLCGTLPQGGRPLAHWPASKRLPVLLASGRASATYREEQVCDDLRLLHAAGMHVTLRQYGCGQELDPAMLADVDRWLMERVTGQPWTTA